MAIPGRGMHLDYLTLQTLEEESHVLGACSRD